MPSTPTDPSVVDSLLAVAGQVHHQVGAVAEAHGLTPQQLFLLRTLETPRPMHELAAQLCCDPSNVTGLIDRLEARRLVERTPDVADRRVKMLSLTGEGKALRRKIEGDLTTRLAPRSTGGKAREAIETVRRLLAATDPGRDR
jgi:DNA-binding MarR family transcriptional regulator